MSCPSSVSPINAASSRLWVSIVTVICLSSGKTIGLMESGLGQIGVIVRLSTFG